MIRRRILSERDRRNTQRQRDRERARERRKSTPQSKLRHRIEDRFDPHEQSRFILVSLGADEPATLYPPVNYYKRIETDRVRFARRLCTSWQSVKARR